MRSAWLKKVKMYNFKIHVYGVMGFFLHKNGNISAVQMQKNCVKYYSASDFGCTYNTYARIFTRTLHLFIKNTVVKWRFRNYF